MPLYLPASESGHREPGEFLRWCEHEGEYSAVRYMAWALDRLDPPGPDASEAVTDVPEPARSTFGQPPSSSSCNTPWNRKKGCRGRRNAG